jgi:hypothetical protein
MWMRLPFSHSFGKIPLRSLIRWKEWFSTELNRWLLSRFDADSWSQCATSMPVLRFEWLPGIRVTSIQFVEIAHSWKSAQRKWPDNASEEEQSWVWNQSMIYLENIFIREDSPKIWHRHRSQNLNREDIHVTWSHWAWEWIKALICK